jgi:hypothetical protein
MLLELLFHYLVNKPKIKQAKIMPLGRKPPGMSRGRDLKGIEKKWGLVFFGGVV